MDELLDQWSFRSLVRLMRNEQVVLFIGAGVSAPFGYPTWKSFLITQSELFGIRKEVEKQISLGLYEEAAELFQVPEREPLFSRNLENEFGRIGIGDGQETIVPLLPELTSGPVFTTNFDEVLERGFKAANKPFARIIEASNGRAVLEALLDNRRALIKLHGGTQNREARVFTKTQYLRHYCRKSCARIDYGKDLPQALINLFQRRTVLFLGCSLSNDRYLQLIKQGLGRNRLACHYAIVSEPKEAKSGQIIAKAKRASELVHKWQIEPIWYPCGRHEHFVRIIRRLKESLSIRGTDTTVIKQGSLRVAEPVNLAADQSFNILPRLDPSSRHIAARFEILNSNGRLLLQAFPALIDRSEEETHSLILSEPSASPARYDYCPRGWPKRPRFHIEAEFGRPSKIRIYEHNAERDSGFYFIVNDSSIPTSTCYERENLDQQRLVHPR